MILSHQTSFKPQLDSNFLQQKEYLELYSKGEEISLGNGRFYQVYRGVVQLNKVNPMNSEQQKAITIAAQETVVGWVTANHTFGHACNNSGRNYRAIALSDVYLRYYDLSQVKRSPRLARLLVSELSYRLLKSEQMVAINLIRRVEDRLEALLQLFKEDLGTAIGSEQNKHGVRLTARFTHQNLADAICTTRVTITRILGEWQAKNLIEFDYDRHLIIKF